MSFLVDRLTQHINNSTRDPEAEKAIKEEQSKIKELIKVYKPIYNSAKEQIILATKNFTLDPDDINLLKTLNESRKTLLDNPTGASLDQFKDNWESTTEKYDILVKFAFGYRTNFYKIMKIIKQARHDNPKAPASLSKFFDKIESEIKKILEETKENESEAVYQAEFQTIMDGLSAERKVNPEIDQILGPAEGKLNRNNYQLDFQVSGGPPVPDAIKSEKEAEEFAAAEKTRDEFNIWRLLNNALSYAISIFLICLVLFLVGLGGCFAVNLNVYKPYPYKILYAIYGSLFSLVVIPYVLIYRWAYLGKRPRFYSFWPIIPRFFVHKPIQFLLGWLTYQPDDKIPELEEWRYPPPPTKSLLPV